MQIIKVQYYLLILMNFIFCLTMSGQSVTEYFNADWQRTNQEHAAYYREITYDEDGKPVGKVKDFWITGELQFEGGMLSVNPDVLDGVCVWYYQNGLKSQAAFYEKGELVGDIKEWSEEGKEEGVLDESGRFYSDGYLMEGIKEFDGYFEEKLGIDSSSVFIFLELGVSISKKGDFKESFVWFQFAHDILSLIHISEPTRRTPISYAVFCL